MGSGRSGLTTSLLLCGTVLLSGCSAIGYAIGAACDRHTTYAADSVSDLSERQRLATMMADARPGKGAIVQVVTAADTLTGNSAKLDTVLAFNREPENQGLEVLLPGEEVLITMRDSSLMPSRGRVQRLSERHIILRVAGEDRGIPLKWVRTITLSDGMAIGDSDFASANPKHLFVHVQGISLGEGSSLFFIPFRQINLIRVSRPVVRWGLVGTLALTGGVATDLTFAIFYRETGEPLKPAERVLGVLTVVGGCYLAAWGVGAFD